MVAEALAVPLAPTAFRWTAVLLTVLRAQRRAGVAVAECARMLRTSPEEVDRAVWALMGRSAASAADALAGRPDPEPSDLETHR